jgi:hypothetical protein
MGWSNVGAVVLLASEVILLDTSDNVVGTLDGSNGLVLYGIGTAANPGLTLTPFGDLFWGNFDVNPGAGPSIEVGNTEMFLSSGNDAGGQPGVVALFGNLNGADGPGVQVSAYLYGNDRTGTGFPVPAAENWKALPLSNGWANVGGAFQVAQYRAMPDGTVMCQGSITGGASTTFATLPAGYRPASTVQYAVGGGTAVAAGASLRVGVTAAGVMTINGENVIGGSFAIDGVRFALPDLV